MNSNIKKVLGEISVQLSGLSQHILSESPCRAFAALRLCDSGKSIKLSGNAEGLVYFASILVGLALDEKPGQHFHFGDGEMLDEAERDLILQFETAVWDE